MATALSQFRLPAADATPAGLRTLHVCMVSPLGLSGRGGIDRFVDQMMQSLAQQPGLNVQVNRITTRGNGSILLAPLYFARALAQLWRARRRGEADLLHVHLSWRGSTYRKLIVVALARHLGIPYIVHLHSGRYDAFWNGAGPRLHHAIDTLFKDAAAIVVLGRYWADCVRSHLPQVTNKITIFPNATLPEPYGMEPALDGTVRITFLGKLCAAKGTPELLEALSRLTDTCHWTATLAGNGEVADAADQAQTLGISERVSFPGWLDPDAVTNLLRHTDILVLPSHVENLPMVILEAFSFGIASVATPVGAVPEVIDHERNGILVPVADVDALTKALHRLIVDPELRAQLGRQALSDHALRFEIGSYVRRMTGVWRQLAQTASESNL